MDASTIYFIIGVVIIAGIVAFSMWRGGKYIGTWMVIGADGRQCYVKRTQKDARNDGKEMMQFFLYQEMDADGRKVDKNCITMIQRRWIIRLDQYFEE